MKKYVKYIGLISIMLFSFYYTNKAALFAKNTNPIMKDINEYKEEVKVDSIDATIIDNYIIPGVNGLEVNVNKSFNKMRPYHVFNKTFFIYDQIKPKVSLEDNKDKVIIRGNKSKKQISVIIENKEHEKLLNNKKVDYELLNNLENKNICIVGSNVNIDNCRKSNFYLVEPKKITKSNFLSQKELIGSGAILWMSKELKNEEVEILIKQILSKDLKIVHLDILISENNE